KFVHHRGPYHARGRPNIAALDGLRRAIGDALHRKWVHSDGDRVGHLSTGRGRSSQHLRYARIVGHDGARLGFALTTSDRKKCEVAGSKCQMVEGDSRITYERRL